jgi:hypothetical protein
VIAPVARSHHRPRRKNQQRQRPHTPRHKQARRRRRRPPDVASDDNDSEPATPPAPAISEALSESGSPASNTSAVGRLRVVDSEQPLLRAHRRVSEILKEYEKKKTAGCLISAEGERAASELRLIQDDLLLALGRRPPSSGDVYVLGTVGALAFVAEKGKPARLLFRPGRSGLLLWCSTTVHVIVGHDNDDESTVSPEPIEPKSIISCCQAHNPPLIVRREDVYYFEFSPTKTRAFQYLCVYDTGKNARLTKNDVTVRDRKIKLPLYAPHADLRKTILQFSMDEEETAAAAAAEVTAAAATATEEEAASSCVIQ